MPDMRDELIQLYAAHKVADVVGDPQYQQLCEQYKGNRQFDGERALVEEAKSRLESYLDKAATRSAQVREALIQLNKHRRGRDLHLYYDLISKACKPNWSPAQQTYFEDSWKLINSEYDFFLSFTTRYRPAGGENPINARYKYFIIDEIQKPFFNSADRSKENLLVTALYRKLAQPPLRGFLFKEYENDNTVTEKKLRDACARAIVFVQVVQNVMFEEPAGRTNYCFFEYKEVKSSIHEEDQLLFVVAEQAKGDLVSRHDVPRPYEPWYDHVLSKDPPYLEEVRDYDRGHIRALRKKFEATIVQKVKDARNRIFDKVPL